MSQITISRKNLFNNVKKISLFLSEHSIEFSLITKVISGHQPTCEDLLLSENIKGISSIGDSRISGLKLIKSIKPEMETMYIKPPPLNQIANIVRYADISLNTSYKMICELNKEAGKQNRVHKVIIMVEMGELREGVIKDNVIDFYKKVFRLKNINILGIGTNLGCMYGVEPTYDKLIQLSLLKELIQTKFKRHIKLISAGSSITLPLIKKKKYPKLCNHLRIGEAVFLGTTPFTGRRFSNLSMDVFKFYGQIIEIKRKGDIPDIIPGEKVNTASKDLIDKKKKKSFKVILDFGKVDVDVDDLMPKDENIKLVGTTSDMTVYDIGDNDGNYDIGDRIEFIPNYNAVAYLMASKFVRKKIL